MGKIEKMGGEVQKKVIKLNVEGMSYAAIADEINKDHDSNINSDNIKHFIDRKRSASVKIIKEDKDFQNKLVQQYFDTVTQLRALNEKMWNVFEGMIKDPEFATKNLDCPHCNKKIKVQLKTYGSLIKTSEHLLNQIKHVDAVLGKMQNKQLNITYNYVDLSKKLTAVMPKMLDEWERRGLVKVNKKRLKAYVTYDRQT